MVARRLSPKAATRGSRTRVRRNASRDRSMMKTPSTQAVRAGVAAAFLLFAFGWFGAPLLSRGRGGQMQGGATGGATPWRPKSANAKYVGAQSCAACHKEIVATQHSTPMGKALETVAESRVLGSHARLSMRLGPYTYEIRREGQRSIYSVTDGVSTIAEPILYSFGQGKAGQTYVLRRAGAFYESRASYYREIDNLDVTIGYARSAPPTLEEAFGRAISMDETRSCFGCHATAAVSGRGLDLDKLMPGVSCEACHGPGGEHVAAMRARDFAATRIFNPGRMSADDQTQEFCGSCHRSAENVMTLSLQGGLNNVRFQPYRIFTSRGHDPGDARLSCTACHDVHKEMQTDAVSYDAKCFACHSAGTKVARLVKAEQAAGRTAKACPVSQRACVTCHMPKVEIPGSHFKFTDHRIRIARPNEPFPF